MLQIAVEITECISEGIPGYTIRSTQRLVLGEISREMIEKLSEFELQFMGKKIKIPKTPSKVPENYHHNQNFSSTPEIHTEHSSKPFLANLAYSSSQTPQHHFQKKYINLPSSNSFHCS